MTTTAQKTIRISILSLITGIYLFVLSQPAKAADVSLVVSPPRIDVTANPGETIQKTIKVTNDSADRELILQARTFDYIVQDNLGTPIRVTESVSGRYLASPWFTLERSELVVPPKTTAQLIVIVTIPPNALPGGHYAGVFFEPVPARGGKNTVSYTTTQVGSLFGITIAGDIKYDALIKNFQTKNNVYEFGPIDFSAEIENQSDTHIRPTTTITVHDMLGRQLANLPLDEVNIFPYTSRILTGSWNQVWGLGRYSATLSSAYGPGLTASRTLYFWILPYRLLAAIALALLVLLSIIILIRRHLQSRNDHRDQEIDELKRKIAELENNSRQ